MKRGHRYIHGMTGKPFYTKWASMKQRCYDKNHHKYQIYGARGITICEKWNGFLGFYEDMFDSYKRHLLEYGKENTTLDRIDVNGNYRKENCRWATISEQAFNRRRKSSITFKGETKYFSQWADSLGIRRSTLHLRLYTYGWSVERAFTTR